MSPALLLLSLCVCVSVGVPVTEDMPETLAVSGEDVVLRCTAQPKDGVQYRAVRWYKVVGPSSSPPRLSGLLTRDLPDGATSYYSGLQREVELLVGSRGVLLPNVTCGDRGEYLCHLAAPVGEQNREGRVLLGLTDCADGDAEELVTDTLLVVVAAVVLMLALFIFLISYKSLKNTIKNRSAPAKEEVLPDSPFEPLAKKDLMLIYTLGPNAPRTTHVCV